MTPSLKVIAIGWRQATPPGSRLTHQGGAANLKMGLSIASRWTLYDPNVLYVKLMINILNNMETWKEFDANELTHSAAHHLVAIYEVGLPYGGWARVSDIARQLDITRGSV